MRPGVPEPGQRFFSESEDITRAMIVPIGAIRKAMVSDETEDVRYCRTPFGQELDFKATSVNFDLDKLLTQAEVPA